MNGDVPCCRTFDTGRKEYPRPGRIRYAEERGRRQILSELAIKEAAYFLGADLCGIAPAARFAKAPAGFRPEDIWQDARSAVVFACRLPGTSVNADSCVPYTHVNGLVTQAVDQLSFKLALWLEDQGLAAVPIPSDDPYEHWAPEKSYGRAILSLRHAGHLAGLGVLGRNNLLINAKYGNLIQIGAVLVNRDLSGDALADYQGCPPGCRLCIQQCPQGALDGTTVDQSLCRPVSNFRTEKGYVLKKCFRCRQVCPLSRGIPAGGHNCAKS